MPNLTPFIDLREDRKSFLFLAEVVGYSFFFTMGENIGPERHHIINWLGSASFASYTKVSSEQYCKSSLIGFKQIDTGLLFSPKPSRCQCPFPLPSIAFVSFILF